MKYKDASLLSIGEASKPQYCFSEKFLPLATVNVILINMMANSEEKAYRVYIDAMIPSYLVAPLSRNPKISEWQRITREFWQAPRFKFIL